MDFTRLARRVPVGSAPGAATAVTAAMRRTTLTGDDPATIRLSWRTNTRARAKLDNHLFGKRILFTNRDHWPIADVVAAYHSHSEAEFGFPRRCRAWPPPAPTGSASHRIANSANCMR